MKLIIDAKPDNFVGAVMVAKSAIQRGKDNPEGRDPIVWTNGAGVSFASKWNAKSLKVWEIDQ